MDDCITIYSQNCQGLGNTQKRRDLFHYIRHKTYNIIFLQDIHITENVCSFVKAEWGNDIYISPYRSNSRGVMILLRDNFEQKVEATHIDKNGNFILLDIVMCEKRITLANIYGPNNFRF